LFSVQPETREQNVARVHIYDEKRSLAKYSVKSPESHTKQTTQPPAGPIFTSILHHDFLLNTWPNFLTLITLFLNNFTWYFITPTLKMTGAGRNM
jgi:hypothetical protein